MRRIAIFTMAVLVPLSLLPVGAGARTLKRTHRMPDLAPASADALTEALDNGQISEAEYALHRASSLFRLGAVRDEFGDVERQDPHSATWLLRDLALRTSSLAGDELAAAEEILARPDDNQGGIGGTGWASNAIEATPLCGPNVCVHYVTNTGDQATPAWAQNTLSAFEHVWTTEVNVMGYREPKGDGTKGGDDRLDVYIDNIDEDFLYGYCATGAFQPPPWDQPVYCAVDNDYANFLAAGAPQTATDLLQVTAAHEFFHAVQYAYDAGDDAWVGEATATWMEDQVYDNVNDSRNYINNSLSRPNVPADSWDSLSGVPSGWQYGQWIWFQYLTQKHGNVLVRSLWERLDARNNGIDTAGPDDYSMQGLTNVLDTYEPDATISSSEIFARSFADFAAVNTKPSAFYQEAGEDATYYAPSPRFKSHAMGQPVGSFVSNVDHLSSRLISFTPGPGSDSTSQLAVTVDMSNTITGSRATLVSIPSSGPPLFRPIDLTSAGEGSAVVPFGNMTEVVLVLTNASNRYEGCRKNSVTPYTCNGQPVDDNQTYTYAAALGTEPPPAVDGTPPQISGINVSPNPVPRGKTAKVSFRMNEPGTVKMTVSRNGTKIGSASGAVDEPGELCCFTIKTTSRWPTGTYLIKMTATDVAGNKATAKKSFKVK